MSAVDPLLVSTEDQAEAWWNSLPPEVAKLLAVRAPRVADAWEYCDSPMRATRTQRDSVGESVVVRIEPMVEGEADRPKVTGWRVWVRDVEDYLHLEPPPSTFDEAQAMADEELEELGWMLR